MHSSWFTSTFSGSCKFYKLKRGGPNFCEEPILRKVWTVWTHPPYFNFKSFVDPKSLSFTEFQCILHDSRVLFSGSWNFSKLKNGDLISGGTQFCRKSELFDPPFCRKEQNCKTSKEQNSSSLIKFQCILDDWEEILSDVSNFYKLKREVLISGGNQFWRKLNYLVPLSVFNFKSFEDPNSLSFIRFGRISLDSGVPLSDFWNFYKLKRGDRLSGSN